MSDADVSPASDISQVYKMQDDGRPTFWKPLNRHISNRSTDCDKI